MGDGVERLDPARVPAVGEQHDDVRHVVVRRARLAAGRGFGDRRVVERVHVADGLDGGVHLGDRVEPLEHRATDRGAATGRHRVDRRHELLAFRRRRNRQLREPREHHETHANVIGLVLDELARRLLGDGQPVRLDVRRAHRPRDVEREDDRRPRERNVAFDVRSPCGEAERDQAREERGRSGGGAASACASAAPTGAARRSSSGPPVGAVFAAATSRRPTMSGTTRSETRASGQANDIQMTRPNQAIERSDPSASRSPPAAANRAVISRSRSTEASFRSTDS